LHQQQAVNDARTAAQDTKDQAALDRDLSRRLAAMGVSPPSMAAEFERVMRAVFEVSYADTTGPETDH
jgi:hypothetical protein